MDNETISLLQALDATLGASRLLGNAAADQDLDVRRWSEVVDAERELMEAKQIIDKVRDARAKGGVRSFGTINGPLTDEDWDKMTEQQQKRASVSVFRDYMQGLITESDCYDLLAAIDRGRGIAL